jgi:protein subunit release factor B
MVDVAERERTTEATPSRAAAGSPQGSRSAQAKKAKPNLLVQRVYNTIDGELTKLEKQKGLTSQDRERASRALSQMVNALEKAVDMQREMTKRKATGGDAKSKEALAHAEDLRREIAERLERLNRKRAPGRRSE